MSSNNTKTKHSISKKAGHDKNSKNSDGDKSTLRFQANSFVFLNDGKF